MTMTTMLLALWTTWVAPLERLPRLTVELVDTTGLSESAMAAIRSEVATVYARGGVRIEWGAVVDTGPETARVYIMEGLPLSLGRRLEARGSNPMALALGRSGELSGPTIYVARSAVTTHLTAGAVAEPDPKLLGGALGRIVAHELAHRFIGRRHTRRGILKADLGGADLRGSSDAFTFTDEQRAQLRAIARLDGVETAASLRRAP